MAFDWCDCSDPNCKLNHGNIYGSSNERGEDSMAAKKTITKKAKKSTKKTKLVR